MVVLHTAGHGVGFAAVHCHQIAATVVAAKGEAGLRGLRDAKIRRIGNVVRIAHAGGQQRIVQIIATADRQVGDLTLVYDGRLLRTIRLHHFASTNNVDRC